MTLAPTSSHGSSATGVITNAVVRGDLSANFTTTSTAFTDLTGATVTIAAATGDKLLLAFEGAVSNSGAGGAVQFTMVTVTGAVNIVGTNIAPGPNFMTVVLTSIYTVASGDISGGNVAVKIRTASDSGANTVTIRNATYTWQLYAVNLLH